jgi:hypothetical protein
LYKCKVVSSCFNYDIFLVFVFRIHVRSYSTIYLGEETVQYSTYPTISNLLYRLWGYYGTKMDHVVDVCSYIQQVL